MNPGLGVNSSNSALKQTAARFSRGGIFKYIRAFLRCLMERYDVTVAALAGDAKSMLVGASGIAAPEVVGHSAENLRNMGSVLRAK